MFYMVVATLKFLVVFAVRALSAQENINLLGPESYLLPKTYALPGLRLFLYLMPFRNPGACRV